MYIIAIIGVIWLASVLNKAVKRQNAKHAALAKQMEKEREAQRRINERLAKEQERQEKAQAAAWERQRKEDAKRDAQLAALAAKQRKMKHQIDEINEDLPLFHRQLDSLMEQMGEWQNRLAKANNDLEWDELRMREAPSAVNGKEYEAHKKAQSAATSKIAKLEKDIRAAEKRISNAEYQKREAQIVLDQRIA